MLCSVVRKEALASCIMRKLQQVSWSYLRTHDFRRTALILSQGCIHDQLV